MMKLFSVGLIVTVLLAASVLAMPPGRFNPNHHEEETTRPTQVPRKYAHHLQEEMSVQDVLGSWNTSEYYWPIILKLNFAGTNARHFCRLAQKTQNCVPTNISYMHYSSKEH